MVQSLKTVPRLTGRGDVDQRKENSRHDLQDKYGERGATEDVPPACRVSRHWVFRGLANRSCELQAPIKPFSDLRNQAAHGGFFPKREAVGEPGVGNSPA